MLREEWLWAENRDPHGTAAGMLGEDRARGNDGRTRAGRQAGVGGRQEAMPPPVGYSQEEQSSEGREGRETEGGGDPIARRQSRTIWFFIACPHLVLSLQCSWS